MPERIIQQRTGHRSIDGLRAYERITEEQDLAVSKILTGDSNKFNTGTPSSSTSLTVSSRTNIEQSDQNLPSVGAQYNNCTVNFFSGSSAQHPSSNFRPSALDLFPMPPIPPAFYPTDSAYYNPSAGCDYPSSGFGYPQFSGPSCDPVEPENRQDN